MVHKSNLEKLEDAGILEGKHFSKEDMEVIETITAEEVEVLVRLRKRVGPVAEGKEHFRPNIAV